MSETQARNNINRVSEVKREDNLWFSGNMSDFESDTDSQIASNKSPAISEGNLEDEYQCQVCNKKISGKAYPGNIKRHLQSKNHLKRANEKA